MATRKQSIFEVSPLDFEPSFHLLHANATNKMIYSFEYLSNTKKFTSSAFTLKRTAQLCCMRAYDLKNPTKFADFVSSATIVRPHACACRNLGALAQHSSRRAHKTEHRTLETRERRAQLTHLGCLRSRELSLNSFSSLSRSIVHLAALIFCVVQGPLATVDLQLDESSLQDHVR